MIDNVKFVPINNNDKIKQNFNFKMQERARLVSKDKNGNAVAGDRTRVTRVTGGNTYHYTTTTLLMLDPYYFI